MIKEKCVVVIPIHSPTPSKYELISFQQCFKILYQHKIIVVAPKGLSLDNYKKVISNFKVISIHPKWLSSIKAYNKLKMSKFFYKLFFEYDYLLTYELDAFIFKDEINHWCLKQYGYIGAPWIEGYENAGKNIKILGVGNSGFSLRKIKPIYKSLKTYFYKNPQEYHTGFLNLFKSCLKYPYRWLKSKLGENYTLQNIYSFYEDIFFSQELPEYDKAFTVAPVADAIKFSFEVNPAFLFKINNNELPMGCHAWHRYDLNFWKPHIEKFGYKL